MPYLSRPRRPHRTGEWSEARAVTFIVTLAARRNVTLAAVRVGMSRKAAYALRARDPAFAAAWDAALDAGAPCHLRDSRQGDEVDEVHDLRFAPPKGDSVTLGGDSPWFVETLAKGRRDSEGAPLAHAGALP